MNGRKENNLILIENGQLKIVALDNKIEWTLGRISKQNHPDIALNSLTISRKHGTFVNMEGDWCYMDEYGKNGTVYNHKHLERKGKRNKDLEMLSDGDTFVFGGGKVEAIDEKTVWGVFVTKGFDETRRIANSSSHKMFIFKSDGKEAETYARENLVKGTVIKADQGMAIYMEDYIYLLGDMEVEQS